MDLLSQQTSVKVSDNTQPTGILYQTSEGKIGELPHLDLIEAVLNYERVCRNSVVSSAQECLEQIHGIENANAPMESIVQLVSSLQENFLLWKQNTELLAGKYPDVQEITNLYVAAHDYSTTMAIVTNKMGFLTNSNCPDSKKIMHIQAIKSSLERALEIFINPEVTANVTPTSCRDFFEQVLTHVEVIAPESGIYFEVNDYTDPKTSALIDPDSLILTIHNILANSMRANVEAKQIQINLFNNCNEYFIQISDDGVGIKPEFLGKGVSGSREQGGTGYGTYAIVRRTLSAGGRIELRSSQIDFPLNTDELKSIIIDKQSEIPNCTFAKPLEKGTQYTLSFNLSNPQITESNEH